MAVSPYGLSIVLDFEDNASDGMSKAAKTFSSLSGSADALTMGFNGTASSLNSLLNMNTSVVGMSVMGSQLQNMGEGVLGTLKSVADQVIDTGSVFENFKITLDALYKDEEKAAEVTNDLFKFATKSPFEVEDLQGMVVTLKSMGLEAFEEVTNSISGAHQKTMDWIGDLQAFRPGYTAQQWKFAIQNFLSGSDTRSAMRLRNLLDIGDLSQYLGHSLGTTVQGRMQDLMEIVEKTGMFGMQEKLMNTWSVVLSNMNDAWTFFTYKIGYGIDKGSNNMYDSATKSARNLLFSMNEIFDNEGTIKSVSEALYGLVHPIERITQVARILSPTFADWLGQHPKVAKMTTAITALGGAGIYAVGSLLKLSAGALNWLLNVQRLGGLTGIFQLLSNSLSILSYKMIGIGAVGGLVYMAWKSNFLGLRTLLTNFSSQAGDILTKTYNDILDGKSLTQSLNEQGMDKFVSGINAAKEAVNGLGQSFREGVSGFFKLFGFNIQSLNDKTFNLKNTLNDFGDTLTQKFTGDSLDKFKEKYGGVLDTVGKVSGALMTSIGVTTLLGGAFRLLSGTASMFGTNLKIIASTLFSPVGLLGAGLTALVLGYEKNFLGLQSTVVPIVDGIKAKMDSLKKSFGQKDSEGKNTILSTITAKMKQLNEASKTWSFGGGTEQQGKSIGEVLAQGIASGLIAFGSPIQKALGVLMYGWALNLGNIQQGAGSFVSQLINAKDLLLEMSTGYGPKSRALAEQFGLQDFADGILRLKDTATSFLKNFVSGFAKSNTIVGNFVKELFPDFDLSLNGILNAFGRLGTKISQFFGLGDTKDVAKNWANIAQKIGEIASKAMLLLPVFGALKTAWIAGVSPLALSGISQSFGLIQSGAAQAISAVTLGFGNMFSSITSFGSKSFNFLKFALQSALLQGNGSNIFGKLQGKNVISGLRTALSNTFHLATTGGTFKQAISNFTTAWRDGIMTNLRQFAITGTKMNSKDILRNFLSAFSGSDLKDKLTGIFSTVSNLNWSSALGGFKKFFISFTGSISSFIDNFGVNIIGTVTKIAASLQAIKWQIGLEVLKSSLGILTQLAVGSVKAVIGLNGIAIGLAAITGLAYTFGTMSTADFKELGDVLREQPTLFAKAGAAWDWFNGKLAGTTSRVTDFIKSFDVKLLTSKVLGFVGTLGDSISSIISGEANDGLAELGGHLMDSLLSGIASGGGRIGESIQNIFTSVTTTIKKYAPSIGRSFGDIVGNVVSFIGKNSYTLFDTAFTIIESFVMGLVANRDKIRTGFGRVLDSLIDAIHKHAPNIIHGITNLVSGIINEIYTRRDELGEAANTIIAPIVNSMNANAPKLWATARAVFGGLMNIIVSTVLHGIANILDAVDHIAGIFATILNVAAVAAWFVPGMQAMAPELTMMALKWNGIALGITGAKVSINGMADELDQANQNLEVTNEYANTLGATLEKNFEKDTNYKINIHGEYEELSKELSNLELREAWANNELVYKVKVTEEGYDTTAYKVERMQNWDGTYSYKLVAQETEPTGKTVVDGNKTYASENPAVQEIQTEPESNSGNGTSEEHPFITSEDVEKEREAKAIENQKYEASTDWASKHPNKVNMEKLLGDFEGSVWDNFYDSFYQSYTDNITKGNWLSSDNQIWNSRTGEIIGNPELYYTEEIVGRVQSSANQLSKTFKEMPKDWVPTESQIETFEKLKGIDLSDLVVENDFGATMENVSRYIKMIDEFKEKLSTGEGLSFEIVADGDTFKIVEKDLDDTSNKVDELDGKTATVNVEQNGAEQSTQEVTHFKGAMEETPELKNVEIKQNGAEESTNKVNGLFSAENSLYDKDVRVKANVFGKSEVDGLRSSIAALSSKEIKITTVMEQVTIGTAGSTLSAPWRNTKNTGVRAGGGLVSLNEAQTLMNEQGGEIVDLPAGSRVYPHDESVAMSYKDGFNDSFAKTAKLIKDSTVSQTPSYATADNSSHDKYDYSVTFGQGSIVVKVDNAKGDTDYKAAAEKIWYYIEQKQRRNTMARRS